MPKPDGDLAGFAVRVLIASAIFVGLFTLAGLLWYSVQILLLGFAGVLFAVVIRGISDPLSEKTGLSSRVATGLVLLTGIGVLSGIAFAAKDTLVEQTAQLGEQIPAAIESIRVRAEANPIGAKILERTSGGEAMFPEGSELAAGVTGVLGAVMNGLAGLVVVLFVGLYIAFDPHTYARGALHLVPVGRRDRIAEVLGAVGYTLKWWAIGQGVDMAIIGLATWLGLWALGVPLAMLLGFITGLFNFIPNFGPLFGMIPAVLLSLGSDDPRTAMYVVGLFLALQTIEGYIIYPLIQQRAADLPEAMTIVAQMLLGTLTGGLGLALAAPIAVATTVAVKMLYVEDALGGMIETPADGDADTVIANVKEDIPEESDKPEGVGSRSESPGKPEGVGPRSGSPGRSRSEAEDPS